ncbi:MAG: hypothetical protein WC481_05375 [Candidatus Omnitrophota bacterium]
MIKIKYCKRYLSLLSEKGRILHIHHAGSARGEVHFDRPFWSKTYNSNKLRLLLSESYEVKDLKGDIRIVRSKKKE